MEETGTAILDYLESRFGEQPSGVAAALEALSDLNFLKKLRREVSRPTPCRKPWLQSPAPPAKTSRTGPRRLPRRRPARVTAAGSRRAEFPFRPAFAPLSPEKIDRPLAAALKQVDEALDHLLARVKLGRVA